MEKKMVRATVYVCLIFSSILVRDKMVKKQKVRATVYNIFRIPLNFIVVAVLANLKSFSGDWQLQTVTESNWQWLIVVAALAKE